MFAAFPPHEYGSSSQDEYAKMYEIYSPEEEKRFGVLAIRIQHLPEKSRLQSLLQPRYPYKVNIDIPSIRPYTFRNCRETATTAHPQETVINKERREPMDHSQILEQVKIIVATQRQIKVELIKDDSTFKELEVDSLDAVEIAMKLEEKFEIEISDKDAKEITSVKAAVEYIERVLKSTLK